VQTRTAHLKSTAVIGQIPAHKGFIDAETNFPPDSGHLRRLISTIGKISSKSLLTFVGFGGDVDPGTYFNAPDAGPPGRHRWRDGFSDLRAAAHFELALGFAPLSLAKTKPGGIPSGSRHKEVIMSCIEQTSVLS
jgi:hypothetical protein